MARSKSTRPRQPRDRAAATAINPAAPADERYDARVEMTRAALRDTLLPPDGLTEVIAHINEQMAAPMAKAQPRGGNLIQGPWGNQPKRRGQRGPTSVMVDDLQLTVQGAWWDKPGLLGFDSMRNMVEQTPILSGIVLTRQRQVARFCRPQMSQADTGFIIGHVDPTHELTDEEQKSVDLLKQFIVNCGWERDPRRRKRLRRDTFAQFMAKSVRDSLCMDSAPIETEFKRSRELGIDGFYAIDGSTIRLCTEQGYEGDDEIFALQVVEGNIRAAYNYDDLVYEPRNPRSDVIACGYGYAEPEMLIRTCTHMLNAMTYNGSFFDKNRIPRGILNLFGNYDQADIAAFKRYLEAMTTGAENAHNLPVMVSKDMESAAQFVEIGGQLEEMAFAKWLTFLTSISCAIYGIAPEEISMESFAASKSSLSGSDTEQKITSGNDKGLEPLLAYYESTISDYILQPFSPAYNLRFVGLKAENEQQRFDMEKLTLTLNEGRAKVGMDPIDGPMGDAPLNVSLLQPWMQDSGFGLPEEPQEDFGDPSAEGDAFGEDQPAGDDGRDRDAEEDNPGVKGGADFGTGAEEPELAKALTAADFGLPNLIIRGG